MAEANGPATFCGPMERPDAMGSGLGVATDPDSPIAEAGLPTDPGSLISQAVAISQLSNKCSELPNGSIFKNGASFLKNKNYKAGSKINQLADMLAKRSQNLATSHLGSSNGVLAHSADPEPPRNLAKSEVVVPPPLPSPPPPPVEMRLETPATPPIALDDYENSTKVKVVKTRTSPRCKTDVEPQQTDSVVKRGKTKQQRRSKKLVEMSTQTAEIQFISIRKEEEDKSSLPPPDSVESDTFVCLYCHTTFSERRDCQDHELSHSQKRKTKSFKCQFCSKKLPKLDEFISHTTKTHPSRFHVCLECNIRFVDERKLLEHTTFEHPSEDIASDVPAGLNPKKSKPGGPVLNVDVNCEGTKKPTPSPRSNQKLSPRDRTDEQYEAEMLFYSHLSGNIQENLSKHLDGKIDQNDCNVLDSSDPQRSKNGGLLSVVSSSAAATPICRAPSPYQTRSKTPNPLPMSAKKFKKLPNWQQKFWEKYNFPTNYRFEHRFWDKNYQNIEKSSLYLKDLSCLDIKTQIAVRENTAKLEQVGNTEIDDNEDSERTRFFSDLLKLSPQIASQESTTAPVASQSSETAIIPLKKGKTKTVKKTRPTSGQGQVVTRLQSVGDGVRQRKGSLDLGAGKKMSLRRQTSLENLEGKKVTAQPEDGPSASNKEPDAKDDVPESSVISGEWVRPRSYLCGTCYSRFNNLWELEDHKWVTHPNVWSNHYEFEDEKLKKLFKLEPENPDGGQIKLPDLYRRHLQRSGALNCVDVQPTVSFPQPCSKCKKTSTNMADLHKHMLDCGGDTTWFLTMYSSPNNSIKRKWRPFGSKRKKQIGRRCLKRSVPSTPTLRNYCTQPKVRTKPGDVETIQKMLANLPEKRTRRAINFDEISTRSQATIHSNRLLRKRLTTTFTSNFLRRKAANARIHSNSRPPRRDVVGGKGSSESSKTVLVASLSAASDVSADATTVSSLRRKFRPKDVTNDVNPVSISDRASQVESNKNGEVAKSGLKKGKKAILQKKKPNAVKTEKDESDAAPKPKLKVRKGKPPVRTKADMVKKIKKKLRNSKRLLEARQVKQNEKRRRSWRNRLNNITEEALVKEESVIKKEDASQMPTTEDSPDISPVESVKKRVFIKKRSKPMGVKAKEVANDKGVTRKTKKKNSILSKGEEKRLPRKVKGIASSDEEIAAKIKINVSAPIPVEKTQTQIMTTSDGTPSIENPLRKSSTSKESLVDIDNSVITPSKKSLSSRNAIAEVRPPSLDPSLKSLLSIEIGEELGPPTLSPPRKHPTSGRYSSSDVEMPTITPATESMEVIPLKSPVLSTLKTKLGPRKPVRRKKKVIIKKAVIKRKYLKRTEMLISNESKESEKSMESAEDVIGAGSIPSEDENAERRSQRISKAKVAQVDQQLVKEVNPHISADPSCDSSPLSEEVSRRSREMRPPTPRPSRRISRSNTPVVEILKVYKEPENKNCNSRTLNEQALEHLAMQTPVRRLSKTQRSSSVVSLTNKDETESEILHRTPEKIEPVEAEGIDFDSIPGQVSKSTQPSVDSVKDDVNVQKSESHRRSPRGNKVQDCASESVELTAGQMSPPKTSPPKSKKAFGIDLFARDVRAVSPVSENGSTDRSLRKKEKDTLCKDECKFHSTLDNGSDDEFLIPTKTPSKFKKKGLAAETDSAVTSTRDVLHQKNTIESPPDLSPPVLKTDLRRKKALKVPVNLVEDTVSSVEGPSEMREGSSAQKEVEKLTEAPKPVKRGRKPINLTIVSMSNSLPQTVSESTEASEIVIKPVKKKGRPRKRPIVDEPMIYSNIPEPVAEHPEKISNNPVVELIEGVKNAEKEAARSKKKIEEVENCVVMDEIGLHTIARPTTPCRFPRRCKIKTEEEVSSLPIKDSCNLKEENQPTVVEPVPELNGMPILEKAEPVQATAERIAEDLPVLKPFEDDMVEQNHTMVRFKIVKKSKKNSSKVKVSPLKIVKELAPVKCVISHSMRKRQKLELLPYKPINTEALQKSAKETDESGSDCEPLSKLRAVPPLALKAKKKLNEGAKKALNKQLVSEKSPKKVNETENLSLIIKTVSEECNGSLEAKPIPSEAPKRASPCRNTQEAVMEKIIVEKLNEGSKVKKHQKLSGHKRAKKHELKRLRVTVTLKEATLKVLDRPATPLNPCKWTLGTTGAENINFEVPTTGESTKCHSQLFPVLSPLSKEATALIPGEGVKEEKNLEGIHDKCVSYPCQDDPKTDIEPIKITEILSEPAEIVQESIDISLADKTESDNTELEIIDEKLDPDIPSDKDEIVWLQPTQCVRRKSKKDNQVMDKSAQIISDRQKCKDEVTTTVVTPDEELISGKEVVSKPEEATSFVNLYTTEAKSEKECENNIVCGSILTIEEATSSEDGVKNVNDVSILPSPEAPKIAEADSSAMAGYETKSFQCESREPVADETKVEMDAVVSSTGPAIQRPKKKRRIVHQYSRSVETKEDVPSTTLLIPEELDRRSRRRSKEIPTNNEFVVDDPLILVDELWSDLDSDSDSKQRRKIRKIRKRVPRKKVVAPSEVDLEALLRNFGTNKGEPKDSIKCLRKKESSSSGPSSRQCIEGKTVIKESLKRLSLRFFSFNKSVLRFGQRGSRLLKVKKVLLDSITIPQLPLLSSKITENPEQVIVCRSTKAKAVKKAVTNTESKINYNPQLKCSLPLDLIGDISMLNNNNLRERTESLTDVSSKVVSSTSRPPTPFHDGKPEEVKPRRSEVIDKIFSCDICQTYYYSSSQLRNHRMSNRHKLKESEVLEGGSGVAEAVDPGVDVPAPSAPAKASMEVEKTGDDTSEMPVLEGPFIETIVEPRFESGSVKPTLFGFSEESLKDIQKAIGCTDEEMLILTLLGDNASNEQEKLDLAKRAKFDSVVNNVKSNGSLQSDLKQRMTSALASLVNKAVNNLLKKPESTSGGSYKSETASFLSKLSDLHCRKEKAILQLTEVRDEVSSENEDGKTARYKYHCTICGNRFEKESTRDYHLNRTHRQSKRTKSKAALEELTPPSEDWNDSSWMDLEDPCGIPSSQFLCSDCGINFLSPRDVREHQRLEHPQSASEETPRVRTPVPKRSDLDPDQERLIATQELQKLRTWRYTRRCRSSKPLWGVNSVKFRPSKTENSDDQVIPNASLGRDSDVSLSKPMELANNRFTTILANNAKRKTLEVATEDDAMDGTSWKAKKSMDVYDFIDSEDEGEPMVLSHVRKFSSVATKTASDDEDSEDNLPLSSVKAPPKLEERTEELLTSVVETTDKPEEVFVINGSKDHELSESTTGSDPGSFKISLENRLLRLDEITLKKLEGENEESGTVNDIITSVSDEPVCTEDITTVPSEEIDHLSDVDDGMSETPHDSLSSYDTTDTNKTKESDSDKGTESEVEEDDDTITSEGTRRPKKIVPLLSATLTNNIRKSESPKFNKEVIVKRIWSRQNNSKPLPGCTDESQSSEIDKETIMKRIWKKKRAEAEEEEKKQLEMKINQTEVSDEVVIKCGPKPRNVGRRKSLNETKDVIVRRIWSGKCGFQTKAALKTYESDIVPAITPAKRRGRPASLSAVKRKRVVSASEDDLDSLLEEIERENVEKAIRLEFLHLRRSDKNPIDNSKEPAGLFAETNPATATEKKRRKIRRNVRVLKRREDLAELRNRKHKRRRRHHHHRKHKHKKSRHHKRILNKHRSKHRGDSTAGGFKVLERMCEDIASRAVSEPMARRVAAGGLTDSRISTDLDNLDSKIDQVLSPLGTFEKRLNGEASNSGVFSIPSEDDSNQCSSNKDP